jgi:ABC-2 type transport system permease protein
VTQVDDGDADAAFLFPTGLSDSLRSASPGTIEVVTSDRETYETLLAAALANRFADGVDMVRVAGATSALAEPPTGAAAGPVSSTDDPVELRQLGLETYYVAGIAAFFVFFTVQFGLITFQSERRDGTLTRMLAAPIRPAAILAGKGLVSLILAVVSVGVVVIASIPLLDTEWGSPLGVAMMVVALSIAAVGIMAAATVLVGTYDQANGLSMVIAVVLGLLGGAFFPLFLGPDLLQNLAVISPHRWWLVGLGELAPPGASAADALPAAGALVAFGLGFGALAAFRAQRMLAR